MPLQIKRNRNGQWYARIVADNGRIICHSESYTRKAFAEKALRVMVREVAKAYDHGAFDKPTGFNYEELGYADSKIQQSLKLTDF